MTEEEYVKVPRSQLEDWLREIRELKAKISTRAARPSASQD